MAKFSYVTKQTDSTFTQGNTNAFVFTDSTQLSDNQIVKVQAPNLTSVSTWITLAYLDSTASHFNRRPMFRSTSGTWMRETSNDHYDVADLKGTIIVFTPRRENGRNFFEVYLCKDEAEKLQIPNYGTIPVIETRVVSSVTKTNFGLYRSYNDGFGSKIPLALSHIYVDDSLRGAAYVVAATLEGDNIRVLSTTAINSTNELDSNKELVVVGQTTSIGSTVIYDLDERVTILESKVSDLQDEIQELSTTVAGISSTVTESLSGMSKFYVSR